MAAASQLVEHFAQPKADKALLLAYIEQQYGELTKGKARDTTKARKMNWGHFSAGHRSGQDAQLNRGVCGMPAQGLLS